MSDPIRRALRTFIQAFLGSLLTSGILSSMSTDGFIDLSVLNKTLVSGLGAALIAGVSFAQNYLEEKEVIGEVVQK